MADNFIASPSRDNKGNLTTPGATFIGDIEAVIDHSATQLVIQAANKGETLEHAAALDLARLEVQGAGMASDIAQTPSSKKVQAPGPVVASEPSP